MSDAADPPVPDLLDDLRWRGLLAATTDEAALRAALAGKITAYCGFDPTAPSLHFGNLVQLIVLRKLQRAGHRVICLVGGSTGLIGDPRPTAERVLKTREQTADWVARIERQVKPFLHSDGANPAEFVNNLDWTAPLSALDFLRDIGRHFRVNTMIRKDAVAARLASDEGINYTEFSYQILQALDFLHLYRAYGCTLQTGGQDQWGNLTAGVDLIHKAEGAAVHLLVTPLLTDSRGLKFGKSEGNAIWLSPEMTSPYAFYQYWFNIEDASVVALLKVFTDRTSDQIAELERSLTERPHLREAQRALAGDVTTLVHGARATEQAVLASAALFGRGDLRLLDSDTLEAALMQAGMYEEQEYTGQETSLTAAPADTPLVDLLVRAKLSVSRGDARRTIAGGGIYVNNVVVVDTDEFAREDDFLQGQFLVLRRGGKTVRGIRRRSVPKFRGRRTTG